MVKAIASLTSLIMFLSFIGCKEAPLKTVEFQQFNGKSMGTFYNITYESHLPSGMIKAGVDSILNVFEDELSTYRLHSKISQFNQSEGGICIDSTSWFYSSLKTAGIIYKNTDGHFDPTVAPLVNYWGFGYDHQKQKTKEDLDTINDLVALVGFEKLDLTTKAEKVCINKVHPDQMLDLNASGKGMGVDIAADYIESLGVKNYLVEIGGEVRANGINKRGDVWTLGVNKPSPDADTRQILIPVKVNNRGMATSGNYRNFYKEGKLTFAHIISPKTGMSQPTDVLSATVLASTCEIADGYATALMAIGLDKAQSLANKLEDIDVCLIYHDMKADTLAFFYSEGFHQTQ